MRNAWSPGLEIDRFALKTLVIATWLLEKQVFLGFL